MPKATTDLIGRQVTDIRQEELGYPESSMWVYTITKIVNPEVVEVEWLTGYAGGNPNMPAYDRKCLRLSDLRFKA